MTAAQPAWRPVEAVVARRFCAAPRCDNEFRPGSLSDPYCSERCAAASAAATAQSIAGPACARPGCQKEARPGFPHCSRDCAEVAAQARAAANPYGDGRAAPRIVDILSKVPLDARLVQKRFADVEGEA